MITIVDFYADWCGTCKQLKPFLDSLSNVEVEYVNVEEEPKKAQLMNIRSLPTLHIYNDDELVEVLSGPTLRTRLHQVLDELND